MKKNTASRCSARCIFLGLLGLLWAGGLGLGVFAEEGIPPIFRSHQEPGLHLERVVPTDKPGHFIAELRLINPGKTPLVFLGEPERPATQSMFKQGDDWKPDGARDPHGFPREVVAPGDSVLFSFPFHRFGLVTRKGLPVEVDGQFQVFWSPPLTPGHSPR